MKTFLLLLLLLSSVYGKEAKPVCFENPFMKLSDNNKIKEVKKVQLYLPKKSETNAPLEMYYTLKNDHTYRVKDIFCSFDKSTETYSCSIECDGGTLEFDTKNHVMRMHSLRVSGCAEITPPFFLQKDLVKKKLVETITNLDKSGFLNTMEHDWVYEKKCASKVKPTETKIFYRTEEYEKAFPDKEKRDFYFKKFYDPLDKKDEDALPSKKIILKKSYKNIPQLMQGEGYELELFKNSNILLFVYNDKRALVFVSSFQADEYGGGCSFNGHYLIELNKNVLTYKYFAGGHGDIGGELIFEMEVIK